LPEGEDVQLKRKKKRRGISLASGSRRPSTSKNLASLPSYLSDFSWIENTDANIEIINQEK
jgi:hypothetical protein